jgi:hypothetical protein
MWIFTPFGFFSVTEPRDGDGDTLQVRARVKEDLDALREKFLPTLGVTLAKIGTDYPYRAFVSKEDFALGMARIILSIDYSNFKATVMQEQGLSREKLYMRVWSVLNDAEAKLEKMDAAEQLVFGRGFTGTHGPEGSGFFEGWSEPLSKVPPKRDKKQRRVRGGKRRKS